MKYIYNYTLVFLALGLLQSCVVEEEAFSSDEEGLVHKVFTASFEDAEMATKTVLDENVGEKGFRSLLWDPEDKIGIASSGEYRLFINVNTEASAHGVFEGSIDYNDTYYAIYPYKPGQNFSARVKMTVPTVQTYRENSFDKDIAPMVGKSSDGNTFQFMNLCGVLAVNLTGSEIIKSIVFQTTGPKVSGESVVDPQYEDCPVFSTDEDDFDESYVTLDCGEGVQLSGEAVPFHIVLPPGTYNGFTLYITTADGKFMKKETSKTLTIKRSIVTKAASFAFENNMTDVTNLSEHGYSNCYVVPEVGIYSFDANIIGNGEFGLIEGAGFHTSNPSISPVSVELLWEDRPGMISYYSLDAAAVKVKFTTKGIEGNALIAAKDADGTILWSWHLWMTDQPTDQNYENDVLDSFIMLDRNIGAIRADRGTGYEWKESVGLYYQWGRKDPFAPGKFTNHSGQFTVAESLKYPTEFGINSNWTSETQVNFWNDGKKTIYDPCPVGYRVPMEDVWYGFTSDGNSNYVTESQVSSTTYDNGWSFYRNSSSETAWYPVTGYYSGADSYLDSSYGYYWSADKNGGGNPYYVHFKNNGYVYQNETTYTRYAYNIRCLKDEDHVDISTHVTFKPVEFSEASTSSVKLSSGYKEGSAVTIVEKGFAYDKSADFSNETRVAVESDGRDFLCTLTDLDNATRYYVRAYAETVIGNETVMFYSDAITFGTRYSEDVVNLSERGTANCYIVSYPGAYSFNCTVKGNSTESVGVPASAEVIWETKNTTESVNKGDIIYNVEFVNNEIRFEATGTYGNALIAIRDASGDILWNWHIWVSDYDPDLSYNTYISGAVMMDRNLGALDAGRTASAYGFLYQWGRKDPLISDHITTFPNNLRLYVSPETPYEYSIKNPTHSIGNIYNDSSSWGQTKTKYDPCPLGWKVPVGGPEGVWAGIEWSGIDGSYDSGSWTINEPYSVPAAIYPAPGYTEGNGYSLMWYGQALYCWSSTAINSNNSYAMHLFDRIERELYSSKKSEFSVRCMKDE